MCDDRHDFGMSLRGKFCQVCSKRILNRGCRTCCARLCKEHYKEHYADHECPEEPRKREDAMTGLHVRASNSEEIDDLTWAEQVRLLGYEKFMGNMPLECSGVFAVTCLLGPLQEEGLQALQHGFESVVTARPILGGRVNGTHVALCNKGVPFLVERYHDAERCPEKIAHDSILSFCSIHDPKDIMSGRAPLLTAKIHLYPDGTVLGVAASHSIMDGSSLFAFLRDWGKACRGEIACLGNGGHRHTLVARLRDCDKKHTVERVLDHAHVSKSNLFGRILKRADANMHKAGSIVGREFCAHILPSLLSMGRTTERVQLSLSNAQLLKIKDLATPLPNAVGDGWVSTQEAVVAHLTLSLWKSLHSDIQTSGIACVSFLVDIRKYLCIDDNFAFGTGFQLCSIHIPKMSSLSLKECAQYLHEECKTMTQNVAHRWCLWHRAFESRLQLDEFIQDAVNSPPSDMKLTINNNSKREAPDFGVSAGGVAHEFMSNMGPTLLIATKDGMDIVLEGGLLSGDAQEKINEFMSRFLGI